MTSVPTADRLSRKRFWSPLTAVIVVTTATMPMMMPSVVSAPRPLLARRARSAIPSDSRTTSGDLIATVLLPGCRLAARRLGRLLVVHLDDGAVLEVLRDRAVAARDDLLAFLHPAQDLDPLFTLDAGRHLAGDGVALLDQEHDFDEAVAVGLEAGLGVLALLALLEELVDGAERDALEGRAQRVVVDLGHDVGRRGHARAQGLERLGDADLDLELGLLVGRARPRGVGAAADLAHDSGEHLAGHGVDLDLGGLADPDVDDVVLVDVDLGFHLGQVGDHEDDIRLELGSERDLARLLVELAHRARHGGVDRRLRQVVTGLLERGTRLGHRLERRLVTRDLDLVGGLPGLEGRLGFEPAAPELLRAVVVLLGLVHVLLDEGGIRLGGADHGLGALDRGQVTIAFEPDQERALLDPLALLDGQLRDARAHVGADLDLHLGLDLPGAVHLLDDLLPAHLGRLDLEVLPPAAPHGGGRGENADEDDRATDPQDSSFHALRVSSRF